MRLRSAWVSVLGIALAGTIACGGGSKEASSTSADAASPAGASGGQKVDTSKAGSVKGGAMIDGAAGKNDAIKMNADPVCVRENKNPQFQETYVVGDDGKALGNVFVYVKDGLGNYIFDTPTERPGSIRRSAALPSARLRNARWPAARNPRNSDPTPHNIHALPKGNSEFNTGRRFRT